MDSLMSEAADLFLASNTQRVKELSNVLKLEARRNSIDVADRSSLALLRRSIATSIKERRTQSDVLDIETSNLNKVRRRKGSITRKPKVKINQLSSDKGNLHIADASSTVGEFKDDTKEQSTLHIEDESEEDPNEMRLNPKECDYDKKDLVEDENNAIEEIVISNDRTESSRKNKIAENGLKLARRNFSGGIFENCSTYSLTCPEVLQERDIIVPPEQNSSAQDNRLPTTAESPAKMLTHQPENVYPHSDPADNRRTTDSDEQQISLSDSFFVSMVNGDHSSNSQSSSISKEDDGIKRPVSKENDLSTSEDKVCDHSTRRHLPKSEKKLNKKLRRRQKKQTKSRDGSITYECPKCGVSYILSANASESTARCLHCDFWISVEPVFLKRGKQPWNTCRIC